MTGSLPRPGSPYRPDRPRRTHMPGQVIVRFKDGAVRPAAMALQAREIGADAAIRRLPEAVRAPMDYLASNAGLAGVRALFPAAAPAAPRARRTLAVLDSVARAPAPPLAGFVVADLDAAAAPAAMRALAAADAIDLVEPAPARWLLARANAAEQADNVQWALKAIGWFKADRPATARTCIGILDTGVDATHPALRGRIAAYRTHGFSRTDLIGHGTHVAGIVSARADRRIGMRGLTEARLKVWKIFPDEPDAETDEFYVDTEAYLKSLGEALGAGVAAVNLSIGGSASSKTEAVLFGQLQAAGIVVVAAVGNEYESGNPVEYPAAYEDVVGVGAIDVNGHRARFSNTGRQLTVMAPGVGILSTVPVRASDYRSETRYATWDGSSMAAPHVAAAIGLLRARHPDLGAKEAVGRLERSARKLPAMRGKAYTQAYGYGELDLVKLLGRARDAP